MDPEREFRSCEPIERDVMLRNWNTIRHDSLLRVLSYACQSYKDFPK